MTPVQTSVGLRDLRRDVLWLQAQNNMNETKAMLKALGAESKEAAVQETQALQTYLVGNKQVLAEKELWTQPIGNEVDVLENTKTLKRRTPQEVNDLISSGVTVEVIPGKLLCSRKAPCGRRKARIVGCGDFGTPDSSR